MPADHSAQPAWRRARPVYRWGPRERLLLALHLPVVVKQAGLTAPEVGIDRGVGLLLQRSDPVPGGRDGVVATAISTPGCVLGPVGTLRARPGWGIT
jgi:hypothetical protein